MARAPQPAIAVLVVEDELLVRLCAVEMLREAGFAVFEAADGEDAIDTLALHPEINVLFTDINMPGAFDGLELARRVHRQRPDVQLIITSGRGQPAKDDAPDGDFVMKPYEGAVISGLIRAAAARNAPDLTIN